MTGEERNALAEIIALLPEIKRLLADKTTTKHKEAKGGAKD